SIFPISPDHLPPNVRPLRLRCAQENPMRLARFAALIILVTFLSTTLAAATRPAAGSRPTTGSRPATTRAATQPDRSSPEKSWTAVLASLRANDLPAFRACFHNTNELSTLFLNAYSDFTLATFQLADAVALLGEEGKAMSDKLQSAYTDLVD